MAIPEFGPTSKLPKNFQENLEKYKPLAQGTGLDPYVAAVNALEQTGYRDFIDWSVEDKVELLNALAESAKLFNDLADAATLESAQTDDSAQQG
jgi:hypothetical protein